jgi:NitT/TauT family transport system permease protein
MIRERFLPLAVSLALLLGVWEAVVWYFDVQVFVLPSPLAIAGGVIDSWPVLQKAVLATLNEALTGFALGIAIGLLLAMALVLMPPLETALMPVLVAINCVPVVAYTPLALIWLGIGPASKIAMVVIAVSFVILLNALQGLKRPEDAAINLLRSFGAGPLRIMWTLRLPAAMPSLVNGMRVGIVRAMIIAIVSEMLGAYRGIGWIIFQATQQVNFLQVWAAITVSSVASMLLYLVLVWVDRKVVWWK